MSDVGPGTGGRSELNGSWHGVSIRRGAGVGICGTSAGIWSGRSVYIANGSGLVCAVKVKENGCNIEGVGGKSNLRGAPVRCFGRLSVCVEQFIPILNAVVFSLPAEKGRCACPVSI